MLSYFVEQIEKTARSAANDIHTSIPGEIVSFDSASCTAVVKPNGYFITPNGKKLKYPTITDAPVVFPFSESCGVGIAYPVKPGDGCLIIISEVELDEWRSGSVSEAPLRFDLTSGVVIPGMLAGGSEIVQKAYDNNAVVIGAMGTEVMIKEKEIKAVVDDTEIKVSKSGIDLRGDLKVKGNIKYTGECNRE